jgi:hypothetical protein
VDLDDRGADRHPHEHHAGQARDHDHHARHPAALAAVAERDPRGQADERHAGEQRERARHVVGARGVALAEHVVHVTAAVDHREDAEAPRERCAHAGPL